MIDFNLLLQRELRELREQGLFREMKCIDSMQGPTVRVDNKEIILLSSNNYLGLASHPEVIKAQVQAAQEFGASASASRLISGNMSLHEKLEERIAAFKGTEAAIIFPTGYMANVGTISALAGEKDLIVCDKLNHASIVDGARLSSAKLRIYPHKNLDRLKDVLKKEASCKKKIIITDGIFSMDGDIAPLPEIVEIARKFNAILMLDDAHATGVLGKKGKGTCEHFSIEKGVGIQMGTFSKALGNLGGFVAGSKALIEYIRNNARSFIYTTALPPAIVSGCIKAIEIIEKDTSLKDRLWSNVKRFTTALSELDLDIMDTQTQIIPLRTKDFSSTMKAAEFLFNEGIFAPGIRPPTVAKTKCRIRASLMATHTKEQIERVIDVLRKAKNKGLFCNRN